MTTLAELRLANLREQKKSAEPAPEPLSGADAPASASEAIPETILAAPQTILAAPPAEREEDLVLSQFIPAELPPAADAPADPDAEKSVALIAHVHSLLSRKTVHANGAKATVDMSPALFHRAKRYCLDHGNVTLRQLFLALLTAFLDEEGY